MSSLRDNRASNSFFDKSDDEAWGLIHSYWICKLFETFTRMSKAFDKVPVAIDKFNAKYGIDLHVMYGVTIYCFDLMMTLFCLHAIAQTGGSSCA